MTAGGSGGGAVTGTSHRALWAVTRAWFLLQVLQVPWEPQKVLNAGEMRRDLYYNKSPAAGARPEVGRLRNFRVSHTSG